MALDFVETPRLDMLGLSPQALEAIARVRDDVTQDIERSIEERERQLIIGGGVSVALSAGFVIWLLKFGVLMSAAASTSPLWRGFDPIPVLRSGAGKEPTGIRARLVRRRRRRASGDDR